MDRHKLAPIPELARSLPALAALVTALLVASLAAGVENSGGAFAGKDGRIAFYRLLNNGKGGFASRIITVNKRGRKAKALTGRCCKLPGDPSWSADGRRIAFTRGGHLSTMNARGRNQERLTRGKSFTGKRIEADIDPSWSPDGNRLAFVRAYRNFTTDLIVVDSDGASLQAIETTRRNPTSPTWAPDGEWIAFLADRLGSEPKGIYRMRPDGSDLELIFELRGPLKRGLDWSPDGKRLAFSSRSGGGGTEIHTVRADGSQDTTLTNGRKPAFDPAFSPSGRRIVFTAGGVLKLIAADGTNQRRLLPERRGVADFNPSWQPR